jgi:adenylate kinase family enzyme
MLIHISGPPGSGKSTLGKYFTDNYNAKVMDIDDIYMKLLQKLEKDKTITDNDIKKNLQNYFQEKINNIINKHKKLILVGLNFPDPHVEFRGKMLNVNPYKIELPTKYKYFITINDDVLKRQLLKRELQWILEDENYFEEYFEESKKKNKLVIPLSSDNTFWKSMYKKEKNYKFYDKKQIKKSIGKLLK